MQHQSSLLSGQQVEVATRVIDVSKTEPYMLVPGELQGPYVTLSHCWGRYTPLVTTKSTLSIRMDGMLMDTLPQMFQDAVFITR